MLGRSSLWMALRVWWGFGELGLEFRGLVALSVGV